MRALLLVSSLFFSYKYRMMVVAPPLRSVTTAHSPQSPHRSPLARPVQGKIPTALTSITIISIQSPVHFNSIQFTSDKVNVGKMRYQINRIKRLKVGNLALLSLLALSQLISPICALSFHTGGARTSAGIQRSPTRLAVTVSSIHSDSVGGNSLLHKRSIIHGGRGRATRSTHCYGRHGTICSMSTPIPSTMVS